MKIRAIRLENVRRFVEPVEITGVGDGLNVLTAPNERGKSTVFDALARLVLQGPEGVGPRSQGPGSPRGRRSVGDGGDRAPRRRVPDREALDERPQRGGPHPVQRPGPQAGR